MAKKKKNFLSEFNETPEQFLNRLKSKNEVFQIEKITPGTFKFEVKGVKENNGIKHAEITKYPDDNTYIEFLYIPEMQLLEQFLKEELTPVNGVFTIYGKLTRFSNSTCKIDECETLWTVTRKERVHNPCCTVHNSLN